MIIYFHISNNYCNLAKSKKYIFIIDEINRGNLSKIFGELLQLIEADYRGEETLLAYNHMPFSVPTTAKVLPSSF